MPRPPAARVVIGITLVVALGAAFVGLPPYWRAAALVVRAADLRSPWLRPLASWGRRAVISEDVLVPAGRARLRGRLYRPAGRTPSLAVVLASGVNPRGLDEPRLERFARTIAASGIAVLTPELPDLLDFKITPRITDQIEQTVMWASRDPRLAPDGRIGLVGISFSGGLSVVAAGRPGLRDRVRFVVSLGGHGDLPRTLEYLCTGLQPDGRRRPAHDYGVAVILHNVVEAVVPPEQVDALRTGIRGFLVASTVYVTDQREGLRLFEEARAQEARLPEPARTWLHWVNTRDVGALGPRLVARLPTFAADSALSPERSPAPTAPVYLLHGVEDNVIPAIESTIAARSLEARGVRVRTLITPLVSHAEARQGPSGGDVWQLVSFWAAVLRSP